MATTYENMVLNEMHKREHDSQKEWGRQHAENASVYHLASAQQQRLEKLKSQVADLCDLQPTPSSMLRPPRKDMLKSLRAELATALSDVESELDAIGGSASTKSFATGEPHALSAGASACVLGTPTQLCPCA